jgi:hypothetical protein
MNKIEKFFDEYCHGNAVVASYWLKISENELFDLMGISDHEEIPKSLLNRLIHDDIPRDEVAALEEVINDQQAKQERLVSLAEETIQIFYKG